MGGTFFRLRVCFKEGNACIGLWSKTAKESLSLHHAKRLEEAVVLQCRRFHRVPPQIELGV